MDFLADDRLEGRAAGTPGYGVAAAYVASVYQTLGLEPAGADGGWYQPYRLVEARLVPDSGRIVVNRDGRSDALAYEQDFLMGGDYLREGPAPPGVQDGQRSRRRRPHHDGHAVRGEDGDGCGGGPARPLGPRGSLPAHAARGGRLCGALYSVLSGIH